MNFLGIDENSDRLSEVTYFTCLKVLSEGLSKLPLTLQRVSDDGGIIEQVSSPLYQTVKVRPNPYMSPSTFWTAIENNRNHFGNAYVWIDRDISSSRISLWILEPDCVRLEIEQGKELSELSDITYVYSSPNSGKEYRISSRDILHFKSSTVFSGLIGLSIREKLKMSLDGAEMSQKMLNNLYQNNFIPKAAVQFDASSMVKDDLETGYLQTLQDYADGKGPGGNTFIPLIPGTSIIPLNIKLTDGQFLELRKYTALQIAAACGIKPNHLNDYEKSSYANSEAQQLAFYTDTMLYILKQYEEELNYKLLSEEQRLNGFRFKFNIAAVLRGDTKSQLESLSMGVSNGIYTPNEARKHLDLPAKDGGDRIYFNGSNIAVEDAGIQYGKEENPDTKALLYLAKTIESAIININKYSDDQPKDDHGRWIDAGGGSSSGGGASSNPDKEPLSDSSGEFHAVTDDAIEPIPEITEFDSKELNQAVHTACKDILKAVKKDPPGTEATVSISLDLQKKSELRKGSPGEGTVTPIKMAVPYISIHNHASGETFSLKDVDQFASDYNNKAIVVVGNNGKVFVFSKTNNYNAERFSAYYLSRLYGIVTSESKEQFLKGGTKYGTKYTEI